MPAVPATHSTDVLVIGWGLAGLVAASEAVAAGKRVVIVDQEPRSNLGGQAWWSFGGLFLALRKREGEAAVQSLIVPAVEYQPARRFRLNTSRSTVPIRFGRLIEQQPDWVWAAVEPLDLGSSDVRSATTLTPGMLRT